MKVSFAPLRYSESRFLSDMTGIDLTWVNYDGWFCVHARNDAGGIMGVLVFEPRTAFDWHMGIAIADPRCISRRIMQVVFTTMFSKAVRITAEVDPDNAPAMKQVERLGFVYEGFKRRGLDGVRDAAVFGMLREDCRFVRRPRHEPGFLSTAGGGYQLEGSVA